MFRRTRCYLHTDLYAVSTCTSTYCLCLSFIYVSYLLVLRRIACACLCQCRPGFQLPQVASPGISGLTYVTYVEFHKDLTGPSDHPTTPELLDHFANTAENWCLCGYSVFLFYFARRLYIFYLLGVYSMKYH